MQAWQGWAGKSLGPLPALGSQFFWKNISGMSQIYLIFAYFRLYLRRFLAHNPCVRFSECLLTDLQSSRDLSPPFTL